MAARRNEYILWFLHLILAKSLRNNVLWCLKLNCNKYLNCGSEFVIGQWTEARKKLKKHNSKSSDSLKWTVSINMVNNVFAREDSEVKTMLDKTFVSLENA